MSVAYDPHGSLLVDDGTITGWPISGDGSSSYSGTVPMSYSGDTLSRPSTEWSVTVYPNSDMSGTPIRVSGTISRPSGC
ncbi:hypothetical protein [Micromonospora sonneratiae]|jgi:hypothetical protein